MKVFYDEKMVADSGSYSPSAAKPKAVVEDWLDIGLPIEVCSFEPASHNDLSLAHAPSYVEGIFAGRIANGHRNTSLELANSTRWTVGSLIAASDEALKTGMSCSPSSGFHHACYGTSGGFCTFNGLMIAALKLYKTDRVKRVGILDCDWHYGNGTDDIIEQLELQNLIVHRTSGSEFFHGEPELYFRWLEQSLEHIWDSGVDLVLYQAGADAHRNDPLGGLLDDDELLRRDEMVFDYCHTKSLPITWCLAGGYQRDDEGSIEPVLSIHRQTARCATHLYGCS